jgi:large subunit ribosomal protein L17
LFAGLTVQLVEHLSIQTTLEKAKELKPIVEKLATLAKKDSIASRRKLKARLDNNIGAALKLTNDIMPITSKLRDSGYLRIKKAGFRRGDNADLAVISFVDIDEIKKGQDKSSSTTKKAEAKPVTKSKKEK